jgi:hypothetical protein
MADHCCTGLRIPLVIAAILAASPAFADAIDGTWCSDAGQTITIEGPAVTMGNKRAEGHYTRHSFTYSPPDLSGIPPLSLALVNENLARSRMSNETGPTVYWHRCEQTSTLPGARPS